MKYFKLMNAAKQYITFFLIIVLTSCETEKEVIELEQPVAYTMPLQVGKYITYRLDSLVFEQAGRQEVNRSYQEKNIIDAQFTDNAGRTSYKLYRFLRNVNGTSPWVAAGTYTITPLTNTLEVNDNNMRVIALAGPIKEGQTWKGNRYLTTEPYLPMNYNFSNDDNIGDWNFVIESISETETFNNAVIKDIITIKHANEILNVPINDPNAFASKTFSIDKYAKGVGLVYQEHVLWEYQPNPNGTPYKTGFGVKRSLLEHN